MINRINLILQAKNITAKQFAESIGIQPSGMSHILSGRNNPSLDFVSKVVQRFPEINMYWLVFGTGEMFRKAEDSVPPTPITAPTPLPAADLFSSQYLDEQPAPAPSNPTPSVHDEDEAVYIAPHKEDYHTEDVATNAIPARPNNGRQVSKIVLFYTDHTFETFEQRNE